MKRAALKRAGMKRLKGIGASGVSGVRGTGGGDSDFCHVDCGDVCGCHAVTPGKWVGHQAAGATTVTRHRGRVRAGKAFMRAGKGKFDKR